MTDLVGMEVDMAADKTVGLSFYSISNDAHPPSGQYKVRYMKILVYVLKTWQVSS